MSKAKTLLCLLSSTVLSIGLGEAAYRGVFGGSWEVKNYILDRAEPLLTKHKINTWDPFLGWKLKSFFTNGGDEDHSFTTGEYGIRLNNRHGNGWFSTGAILAVGDSFTAGSEVGDAQTWPAALERKLGTPVLNAATGAWGTDQISLRAQLLAPILKPKLIIVDFLADDIERANFKTYGGGPKPWYGHDGRLNLPVSPSIQPHSIGPFRQILGYSFALDSALRGSLWWNSVSENVRADNNMVDATCQALKHLVSATQVPILLVIQHGGDQVKQMPHPLAETKGVIACASHFGLPILDTWPELIKWKNKTEEIYNMADATHHGHMNARGNELIAELIAREIQK